MSIIVDGRVIRTYPKSDASSEQDRREENLWAAMMALEAARTSPFPAPYGKWQAWMMTCLNPIAAHFEVDSDAVLALWAGHYGVGLPVQGEPP